VRYRLIVAVALLSLPASRVVWADARTETAREHYVQGDAYYKLDRYGEALHEYEQAYIAKPDPSFLYNIAQCHRLMGDKPEAAKFYRRYLKDAPAAPNRAIAEKHIHDLEASLAHEAAGGHTEPPRGHETAPLPPPVTPITTTTPPASAPAPASGHALALAATPPPPEATAATPAPQPNGNQDREHPFYTRWWFWTAIGVVVGGAIIVAATAGHDPTCPAGSICK
jgi:tetratricopeptide (TPR) repeat protein